MKSNFEAMSDKQLLEYVRYHLEDKQTFHFYMDRLDKRPGVLCTTDKEIDAELRKRIYLPEE